MKLLYSFSIAIYHTLLWLSSFINKKAKLWVEGRKKQRPIINAYSEEVKTKTRFWIHCASLGEFEQGRPIIEALKEHENIEIVLTFFSPSGYELRKSYEKADKIFYLPIDLPKQVNWFLDSINIDVAIFIKYEFWFNYIQELSNRNIPIFLASGIFRKEQHFFKFYGNWFKSKLRKFDFFFLQNQESSELLKSIDINTYIVNGDTRFDQVFKIKNSEFYDPIIESFVAASKTVVFGSSWAKEEELALELYKTNLKVKIIIAPHELSDEKRNRLQKLFKQDAVLYSKLSPTKDFNFRVLILDTMGMLSKVYRYAEIAVIGGGFVKGIHNTIEAAIYGIPVVFGPNYKKFHEAVQLIQLGAAFNIQTKDEFILIISKLLSDSNTYSKAAAEAEKYCNANKNATNKILNYLQDKSLLK